MKKIIAPFTEKTRVGKYKRDACYDHKEIKNDEGMYITYTDETVEYIELL